MLLIIEALLLILAALGQDSSATAGQIFPLDMAPDSVDDQYAGCRDKMANLVKTKLLNNELKNSPGFKTAWGKGVEFPKSKNNNLTKNHEIAIFVYSDSLVYEHFNRDTRRDKNQYKHGNYKWYSLYFLLTEAIRILTKTQNQCMLTYRRTNVEFTKNVLNKEVRFGSFASSSLSRDITRFGNVSCFEINTCEGADLTKYSKLPREKEVLIPPYEKFKVTAVKTRRDQQDLWCETVFTLKSTGTRSDLNCALFKKPSKTKTKSYVLNNVL
ncbi:NAD(P)(+)--arginine ADP-ribosyltransferase 2-like [Pimephales promelas]|uniref:NAD(P)(+)--arginine ADP-ribosyltransferase 2-like n=1 Tax=Pimephales promelas TaxID=90988 RepID=UPI0019557171|nr:NAD(P)(+)--arginine ADP-ribosyltransferase 2-like [Pimephales promelas]XP_039543564.1 NAD(P)(+)--arginine ADP-ribosyltransferase 2-like [Pimephales promelas]XP_039543565.1 NAD(P)(+)--arginine ADP-ribosyltransferase 2-like [Pimephales promelas]XP_039543567.1 NAD(P)(+)--arginine ADP-ribosyltransferase 2-like [Pimephales promelas]KAG1966967.1 NAD(P)(+)--arginine ADP-ribosyltransferase 2-like [Pimephales promelas]